jgi:hypothetical protein
MQVECGNASGMRECEWNAGMRVVCGNASVCAGMNRESVGRVQECEYGSSRACVRMLDPGRRLLNLVFGDRSRPCQVIIVVVS